MANLVGDIAQRLSPSYVSDVESFICENRTGHECVDELTPREFFDYYLKWNGFIGYTDAFIRVIEACGWRPPE